MRFLYLFLILLFSNGAVAVCDIPEASKICAESCKAGCTEPTREVPANQVQERTDGLGGGIGYTRKGDTAPLTKTSDGKFLAADYYFPGATAAVEADEEAPSCDSGHAKAQTCCNDPVTCLGGEHLSTLNQVNNIATQVGPGMSMLLQGTGKDMSGMCEALQAMAGAGAGLSTAALAKCKGSISSCYSACDRDIKTNCQKYSILKAQCEQRSPPNRQLEAEGKKLAAQIVKDEEKIKPACSALNAKAGEIIGNLGQMANSALSAELCKKQASAMDGKEDCAKAGGRWDGYKCITPEGECEKRDGIWDGKKCKSQQQVCMEKGTDWRWNNIECVNRKAECEEAQNKGVTVVWDPLASLGKGECRQKAQVPEATVNKGDGGGDITNPYGGGINLNTETPGSDEGNRGDPDDPDNQLGGGGKTPAGISSGGSPGSSDLLSGLKSSGTNSKAASPTNTAAAGKKGSYRGAMGGFGSGYRGRRPAERASGSGSDKEKPGLSMGGGGFSGYGGGSGDGDDSYASLGLSKKKLKELEKKAGAKRKAASEGLGGAHQNIFERITKRFQSLCKNKLDCR